MKQSISTYLRAAIVAMAAAATLLGNCIAGARADAPTASWADAEIGAPSVGGSHAFANGAFTITGGGGGLSGVKDQVHYTYRPASGDVEVVARITAFTGSPKAQVGIMLRASIAPDSNRAAAVCSINTPDQAAKGSAYTTYHTDRNDRGQYRQKQVGYGTTMPLPFWLRIDRVGNDYGVYKSPDGKIWSVVHNDSGGPFFATGPIELGFFIASGDPKSATPASATIDNIRIGKPDLLYKTSWIGNTYSQDSTGYVTGTVGAMWVGPDGTVYTNSYWDEGGEAAKIYKDGKVVKNFENAPFGGNNACGEGTITSDGTHMYLANTRAIYQTDMLGHSTSAVNLWSATNLYDAKHSINVTSGMAFANGLLYVGDSIDNKILVFDPSPGKFYYKAGNTSTNISDQPIDTSGVANAASAIVYQSQRECDYLPYIVPGLDANTAYTVRFHFADYKHDKPGDRIMGVWAGDQKIDKYDIVATAGGRYKAAVLDMPNAKTDKDGNMSLGLTRAAGSPDGHIVVCGFEILKADGSQAVAVNCGGAAVGGFKSEVYEVPSKEFAFDRPGPMAADKRGDLWIIQESSDFHGPAAVDAPHLAGSIKYLHPDGTSAGKDITDVENPTSVAYDSTLDRLLVTDNGPAQNVRIYSGLTTGVKLASLFGARGGIYAGAVPGRLFDATVGGWARLYQPNAIGIDGQGDIYVNCSGSGTDLRKYTPAGQIVWKVQALHFVDCGDFDPDSDGMSVFTPFKHDRIDYSNTAPGGEWSYVGHNWNALKYGPEQRGGGSSAVVRRLGPKRTLIMYTSGQGSAGYIGIYRFDGDTAVPCGQIGDVGGKSAIWIDANGDGKQSPEEISTAAHVGAVWTFNVDNKGDVWIVYGGATFILHHLVFKGLNAIGAPIYDDNKGDYEDIAYPSTGLGSRPWGQIGRVVYDSDRDVMYLMGPAVDRVSDKVNTMSYIARYDNWSKGNRTARWVTRLADPSTDVNFMYTGAMPYGLAYQYEAFDVAVDKVFVAEMWGPVHVYDATTGKLDLLMNNSPEVSGCDAWEDENMGIRATKRANGEYVVIEENSGFRAKDNLFRWKP